MQVCPTGIDIRKGLQYECIGCAACIDVCDGVMDKMQYPRGLIRYDTQNGLAQHLTPRAALAPRAAAARAGLRRVLLAICAALLVSLSLRTPFKVDVVRDRAALARMVDDGRVENVYRLQIMNATECAALPHRCHGQGLWPAPAWSARARWISVPAEARWVPVAVQVPPEAAARAGAGAHPIEFQIEPVADAGRGRPGGRTNARPSSCRVERSTAT